jgi:DNA-directed RNA polymerase specialized sigma24 family protein
MRHSPIPAKLFVENRQRLAALLPPKSVALFTANDVPQTNADGSLVNVPNSDLFYLSGIEQEESVLLVFPDAVEEKQREILTLRIVVGLSAEETAEAVGSTPGAVRVAQHRALARLKSEITEGGHDYV